MPAEPAIGAVILAAGAARRYGADKRLQPLATSTVAETTIEKYLRVFDSVRVVLKGPSDPLTQVLSKNAWQLEVVYSPNAHLGMGHSLAAGVKDLEWEYTFVALADMPLITAATLRELKETAKNNLDTIIRPRDTTDNANAFGHPIGFPHRFFAELANCQGDEGARGLLKAHKDSILTVDCLDPGVIQDIDTPAALRQAHEHIESDVR